MPKRNSVMVNDFYAKRLGKLQAKDIQLKVLTDRLIGMSSIDILNILLSNISVKKNRTHEQRHLPINKFNDRTQKLLLGFERHHQQLIVLQRLLITQDNIKSSIPKGGRIKDGWISSYYGNRNDPCTGKQTFHDGLYLAEILEVVSILLLMELLSRTAVKVVMVF